MLTVQVNFLWFPVRFCSPSGWKIRVIGSDFPEFEFALNFFIKAFAQNKNAQIESDLSCYYQTSCYPGNLCCGEAHNGSHRDQQKR